MSGATHSNASHPRCRVAIRETCRAPSLGTPKDKSRKALKTMSLSLHTGSARETRKRGSFTEDFERHVYAGSGNRAFLLQRLHTRI
jgi:hypothetical protein